MRSVTVGSRVDLRGTCTREALTECLAGAVTPAILCDCEGAEDDLLNPEEVQELKRAVVLVETHDAKVPGVTERLIERFTASHDIEKIPTRTRSRDDIPEGVRLLEADALRAMREREGSQFFLFMKPRQ